MSNSSPSPTACLFCDKLKSEASLSDTSLLKAAIVEPESPDSENKDLFWICESCKSSEKAQTKAFEEALLLENLSLSVTSSGSTTTASVATEANENSRTVSFTMATKAAEDGEDVQASCRCQACAERRHSEMELEQLREIQDLQKAWVTLRHAVRQLYRDGLLKDGSTTKGKKFDFEKLKDLVDRLCSRDPHQLYQRLESQGREYVMELKVNMLHLLVSSENTAIFGDAILATDKSLVSQISLSKATYFLGTLMRSFIKFQQTVRNMSTFFLEQLEVDHLEKFGITWETVNRHLFESMIFQESLIQTSLPIILAQLGYRKDAASSNVSTAASGNGDAIPISADESSPLSEPLADNDRLLSAWPTFERLMNGAKELWDMAQERMEQYTVEQMRVYKATLKAKQRMLREDLEFFKKQRRLLEEYVNRRKKKAGVEDENKSSYTDMATFTSQLRAVLTSSGREAQKAHQASPTVQCQNCQALHCPCDECAISHMIACGIISPDDEVEDLDLPLDDEDLIRSLERSPTLSSDISSLSDTDDGSLDGFDDSNLLSEENARALCSDGEKMSEFRHKMASLLPSTLYTLHDHAESPSISQHIENAYGEWETHLDPKARKLAFNHPACELLEKTLEQLNVAGKTDKEKYEIGYQMGVKIATAGLPPDELKKIQGDIIRTHLQLTSSPSNASSGCSHHSSSTQVTSATEDARKVEMTKSPSTTVRPRQSSVPTASGARKTEVSQKPASTTHSTPSNIHSSKIPADILEMLKDEKLSKALSAAAKKVRASGGGPSDFLQEAESIKKYYNSHFTSSVVNDSGKNDSSKGCKQTKETVGTQVENGHEPDDKDAWSERSDVPGGEKHCDCCYCEVFGHSNSHAFTNNQSYPRTRERLRRKLNLKQCESTTCMKNRKTLQVTAAPTATLKPSVPENNVSVAVIKGNESLDTLLEFINGAEEKKFEVLVKVAPEKSKNKKVKVKQSKELNVKPDAIDTDYAKNDSKLTEKQNIGRSQSETLSNRASEGLLLLKDQPKRTDQQSTAVERTVATPKLETSNYSPVLKGPLDKQLTKGGKVPPGVEVMQKMKPSKLKAKHLTPTSVAPYKSNGTSSGSMEKTTPKQTGPAAPMNRSDYPAIDEVFIPKNIDLEELDEAEREVESFKRFVFDCPPIQHRTKVNLNISNILRNLKLGKQNSAATAGCF